MKLIARTFAGLENILETELKELGAKDTLIQKRAVAFEGDKEMMYKVNMFSRLTLDVLTPIKSFTAKTPEELYTEVRKVNWSKYLNPQGTFSIAPIIYSSIFTHSQFAMLKTKDAIVDQFREAFGSRPDIEKYTPDLRIVLKISEHKCELLLNSSGAPLFKRGYRSRTGEAPLNEILAAGIITLTGWNKKTPFIDPMCGSGTIPIEAAMIARNIAPCLTEREYGFEKWNDFDESIFNKLYDEAKDAVVESRVIIKGYDIDMEVLAAARGNLKNFPLLGNSITFEKEDFFNSQKTFEKGILVFNPPYDKRINVYNVNDFYSKLGTVLKHSFENYDAWIFSGNLDALKNVGLKPKVKIPLFNGPEESRLVHYPLYLGTKRYGESN